MLSQDPRSPTVPGIRSVGPGTLHKTHLLAYLTVTFDYVESWLKYWYSDWFLFMEYYKYDTKNTEEPWGKVEYGKTYKYFKADKKQL